MQCLSTYLVYFKNVVLLSILVGVWFGLGLALRKTAAKSRFVITREQQGILGKDLKTTQHNHLQTPMHLRGFWILKMEYKCRLRSCQELLVCTKILWEIQCHFSSLSLINVIFLILCQNELNSPSLLGMLSASNYKSEN